MRWYAADLHVHSALSPCADDEMTPHAMAQALGAASICLAAVTDHNSCENSLASIRAFADYGVASLVGMELETAEEVHVLCLFSDVTAGISWQKYVYERLPWRVNDPVVFGSQLKFELGCGQSRVVERMLALSSEIALEEAFVEVKRRGGLCIPAHVDRQAYSLLGMLGVIPRGLEVAALEFSAAATEAQVRARFAGVEEYSMVSFSDAHGLSGIVPSRTAFYIAEPTLDEIDLALQRRAGRRVVVLE